MKRTNFLILVDSGVNLFLGVILLANSYPIVNILGLPKTDQNFYPNILGAVLFGIGIALLIEYRRRGLFVGLRLGGAICINLIGGTVLFLWLVFGNLNIPVHGKIALWVLAFILVEISSFELSVFLQNYNPKKIRKDH